MTVCYTHGYIIMPTLAGYTQLWYQLCMYADLILAESSLWCVATESKTSCWINGLNPGYLHNLLSIFTKICAKSTTVIIRIMLCNIATLYDWTWIMSSGKGYWSECRRQISYTRPHAAIHNLGQSSWAPQLKVHLSVSDLSVAGLHSWKCRVHSSASRIVGCQLIIIIHF